MDVNQLRKVIQGKLKTIEGLTAGRPIADEVVEENIIYYGYELTTTVENSDVDYKYDEYSISLTGRLVSKNKSIAEMDAISTKIVKELRELRFRTTVQDVTQYDKINKLIINGYTSLNECNNYLR